MLFKYRDEGVSFLQEMSKKLGINFYTCRDWMWAYESYILLPENERAEYKLYDLKRLTKKLRKEKRLNRLNKTQVVEYEAKKFYSELYNIYNKVKKLENSSENLEHAKKILFVSGLLKAATQKFMDEAQIPEIIEELEEDINDPYIYDEDIEKMVKN